MEPLEERQLLSVTGLQTSEELPEISYLFQTEYIASLETTNIQ
jgi:hypothetical protein